MFVFRPGFIQPRKGVRSATRLYQTMYDILTPLYPLFNRAFPNRITSSDRLGLALIRAARKLATGNHFSNKEINALAAAEQVDLAGRGR